MQRATPARVAAPRAGECGTIPAMTMLWQPSEEHLRDLPLTRFAQQVEAATGHCFEDYAALHASILEEIQNDEQTPQLSWEPQERPDPPMASEVPIRP